MGLPTLEEFLASSMRRGAYPTRGYVREDGFSGLYVRYTTHYIGRRKRKVFDIVNVNATRPGDGAFTALMLKLALLYPRLNLRVECVLTERFAKTLVEKYGFHPDANDMNSYYLLR